MEELKSKTEDLFEKVSSYTRTYYELTMLNAADKATGVAAAAISSLVMLLLGICVLFFLGLALGVWLGSLLESPALGYLLVAALYLLIILIVVALRKKLIFPFIRNQIINKLYDNRDQDIQ